MTPLIHYITNEVTINDVANMSIACGGRPIMASHIDEVEEVANHCHCLVINSGTPKDRRFEAIEKAVKVANAKGIPIVLDPVGVQSSNFRRKNIKNLLNKYKISLLKLNSLEGMALLGSDQIPKGAGVDGWQFNDEEMHRIAEKLYCKYRCTIVLTGETTIVTTGQTYELEKGSTMLRTFTGSGCMLNAVIGACLGKGCIESNKVSERVSIQPLINSINKYLEASKICEEDGNNQGPIQFKNNLIDRMYLYSQKEGL